jgi:hypothetical protein
LIPLGERHHRRAVTEFVAHYHRERNHQGLDNELIERSLQTGVSVECGDGHVLVGCSITTPERRERLCLRFARVTGHYGRSIILPRQGRSHLVGCHGAAGHGVRESKSSSGTEPSSAVERAGCTR